MGNQFQVNTMTMEIRRLLNLGNSNKVEITVKGDSLIITKARTNAEKRAEWVNTEIRNIPRYVRFVRDHNTVIAYQQFEGIQKSAFAICAPNDIFDIRVGKCIAYFRMNGWTPPDFVLED